MINPQNKQDIIDRADIVEVIGDFVKLKKSGSGYTGLCPFHNEKTGSFHVNAAKQFFKCFGCGVGGDSIKFIMDHEKKTFPDALRYLAAKYNILIQEEEPDPEQKKVIDLNEKLFHLNEIALKFFAGNAKVEYIEKRFTPEQVDQWNIGFAPDGWDNLLNHFKELKVLDEFIVKSDLFGFSEKTQNNYDFFRNRVIFPIIDNSGRVAGFGGRVIEGSDIKYLNSPDSDIYPKSRTLYGLNFARKEISKKDNCIIVEGYTDVISMHTAGVINTVAPCGTALTRDQLNLIKRYTKTITLLYDADESGLKAARKNGKLAIENGFNVYIALLPEGEDPDSFAKKTEKLEAWLTSNRKDYILQRSHALLDSANGDPLLRHEAINDICGLLFHLDKSKQDIYIEQISKESKLKAKLFADKLAELKCEAAPSDEKTWLPDQVDPNDFEKWGFYAYNNEYHFRTQKGIEKFSNFIMKPVFHIDSFYDSRRIYEMINFHGHRVVINLDMNEMTGLQAFQKNVEAKGNFMFWGTMAHFQKLKLRLYEETRTCEEIKILGWQKQGFWAWSNGIIDNGKFQEIDEFGVVNYNEQNYFIPAFSKIYIADKTVFIDERKFRYKPSDVTLRQWSDLFMKVFDDNAKIGIAFWVSTLFRDHLLHIFKNFPILNLFGPKGTGKSQMAMSMSCLFGIQQTPFNIHNGTKPGLAEHIQQFSNAFAWIDEYKNSLEYDKIETLKSIYDAIGRSRMNMDKGRKKETTEVNSGVILSGQEMPTADVALFSRVIFLQFNKTEFNDEEKANYDHLKKMERPGLSHLSGVLVKLRKIFEENYYSNYETVLHEFTTDTKSGVIEDRILRSMVTIVASFRTMENHFDFGFSYENLKSIALQAIKDQNSQIQKSNEVGIFWNNLEAMFDDNLLIDKWHFRIDFTDSLKLTNKEINFKQGKLILKFKYNSIYKLYAENVRKQGMKPLPSDTLKYYLENNKHFIGVMKSCKFTRSEYDPLQAKTIENKQVTTAFCFDYTSLGINLTRDPIEALERDVNGAQIEIQMDAVEAPVDNLPF